LNFHQDFLGEASLAECCWRSCASSVVWPEDVDARRGADESQSVQKQVRGKNLAGVLQRGEKEDGIVRINSELVVAMLFIFSLKKRK